MLMNSVGALNRRVLLINKILREEFVRRREIVKPATVRPSHACVHVAASVLIRRFFSIRTYRKKISMKFQTN